MYLLSGECVVDKRKLQVVITKSKDGAYHWTDTHTEFYLFRINWEVERCISLLDTYSRYVFQGSKITNVKCIKLVIIPDYQVQHIRCHNCD